MTTPPNPVETQLAQLLQAGRAVTVRWNCGGDESFVTTALDGQELEMDYDHYETDFGYLLDQYLTERLALPDVGEFSMTGEGRILLIGSEVVIEYESRAIVYWEDYGLTDEELRELGVELPDRTPAEAPAPVSELPAPAAEAAENEEEEEEEEPAGTFDQDMSDDYSGREVLFTIA